MDITIKGSGGRESRVSFGSLAGLASEIESARTVLVTDGLLRKAYGSSFPPCPIAEVERGEAAKSLASLEALYGRFLELGLGRDGLVLAVGGGAVSDLAGFAAATWLRGVDFGFAPTTLLAMVDASVGGKNGVDFHGIKNLVGTFSQPRFVRMDLSLLSTLPEIEFASGMGEVVKHAVLAGGPYFDLIEGLARKGRAGLATGDLEAIVAGSVELKAAVVSRDERESGERRKLNLGHSFGHGIEAATGLPHGHSVAAGLGTICRLAVRMGRLGAADCDRITRLLSGWGLPSSIAEAASLSAARGRRGDGSELRETIAAAIPADKKRMGESVRVALPEAIGSVRIESVSLSALQDFAKEAP
jgi:3-dehydroquinate synthase